MIDAGLLYETCKQNDLSQVSSIAPFKLFVTLFFLNVHSEDDWTGELRFISSAPWISWVGLFIKFISYPHLLSGNSRPLTHLLAANIPPATRPPNISFLRCLLAKSATLENILSERRFTFLQIYEESPVTPRRKQQGQRSLLSSSLTRGSRATHRNP